MDKDVWGVKVGPVIVGGVSDRKPPTKQDRFWSWVAWAITIVLIGSASPVLGVVLVIGSAIVLAAMTAPDPDERNSR